MLLADIGDSVERGFTEFFAWLPQLIGAIVILIIGYIVARLLAGAVRRLLQRSGFDRSMTRGQVGSWVQKATSSPAGLLATITFWVIFLGAVSLAVTALGIDALTDFVAVVYGYLPHVIAALLIFLVATAIAGGIAALVARTMGDTPTGKVVGTVAPGIVMAIAVFMILQELQIAEGIVMITYAAIMGSLALAAALAFGLGGRDVAGRMLEAAYAKGQESREQVRHDLQVGRERAKEDMERVRERVGDDSVEGDDVPEPPSRRGTVVIEPGDGERVGTRWSGGTGDGDERL